MMSKGKPFNTLEPLLLPYLHSKQFDKSVIITFEMIIDEKMEKQKGFKHFSFPYRLTFETYFRVNLK